MSNDMRMSHDARIKHAKETRKVFGDDNVMFDVGLALNNRDYDTSYYYGLTCKLCGHFTERYKRDRWLCAGCYREWDPETDSIIKPSNRSRRVLAKANGKLVLPCDRVEETPIEPIVEPVPEKVVITIDLPPIDIAVREFTHVKLQKGQVYQIGDYIFEAV